MTPHSNTLLKHLTNSKIVPSLIRPVNKAGHTIIQRMTITDVIYINR